MFMGGFLSQYFPEKIQPRTRRIRSATPRLLEAMASNT